MAETVHLFLKANGAEIKGESTQTGSGCEGSIECLSFQHGVFSAREAGSGMATGRRQYKPLKIQKRLDASSPLLMKALVNNEKIDAEFQFYRPDPDGTGQTEHFYTILIEGGFIEGLSQVSDDVLAPGHATRPPMEEVAFVFHKITWTYERSGVTHMDSWSESR